MPQSALWLIKRGLEYQPLSEIDIVPRRCRGIYVLYRRRRSGKYDVVYVGMAASGQKSGMRGRLMSHRKNKNGLWTHFSAFEVWDNITNEQVAEFEGLFRHFYRKDTKANRLNVQKGFKKMRHLQGFSSPGEAEG